MLTKPKMCPYYAYWLGASYHCVEHIYMVPKVFETLKFYYMYERKLIHIIFNTSGCDWATVWNILIYIPRCCSFKLSRRSNIAWSLLCNASGLRGYSRCTRARKEIWNIHIVFVRILLFCVCLHACFTDTAIYQTYKKWICYLHCCINFFIIATFMLPSLNAYAWSVMYVLSSNNI